MRAQFEFDLQYNRKKRKDWWIVYWRPSRFTKKSDWMDFVPRHTGMEGVILSVNDFSTFSLPFFCHPSPIHPYSLPGNRKIMILSSQDTGSFIFFYISSPISPSLVLCFIAYVGGKWGASFSAHTSGNTWQHQGRSALRLLSYLKFLKHHNR